MNTTTHHVTGRPEPSRRRRARLGRWAVLSAVAAGAVLAPMGAPAHAHDGDHRVNVSTRIVIHDDDLWPNPDDNGSDIDSASFTVGPDNFSETFSTSTCVGGEVKGDLKVVVEHQSPSGSVRARVRGRLYEAESCPNTDLDGDSGERVLWVALGSTRTLTFRVHNGEPGDAGYNDYTVRVQNLAA